MRKRNCRLEVRFSDGELASLAAKAEKAGLSKGEFVRQAVQGVEVREAPTADVRRLIWEVRRVGYNLEQVLKIANTRGLLDVPEMRQVLRQMRAAERLIVAAYTGKGDS